MRGGRIPFGRLRASQPGWAAAASGTWRWGPGRGRPCEGRPDRHQGWGRGLFPSGLRRPCRLLFRGTGAVGGEGWGRAGGHRRGHDRGRAHGRRAGPSLRPAAAQERGVLMERRASAETQRGGRKSRRRARRRRRPRRRRRRRIRGVSGSPIPPSSPPPNSSLPGHAARDTSSFAAVDPTAAETANETQNFLD